jgi:hypothetical protein
MEKGENILGTRVQDVCPFPFRILSYLNLHGFDKSIT